MRTVAQLAQLGGTVGIRGKRTPPAIEEFVVKTKQNAPGLTHQNIVDRVVEQFGESNRIDQSSVPRILARAGLQQPSPDGATGNQSWDRKGYYQGSGQELDREHRQTLMAPLLTLKELQPLGIHDYDLAIWHSRPDESNWPVAKGRVWRTSGSKLEVRLDIEATLEYRYLRQHLPADPLWSSLEAWKKAMVEDLRGRFTLLKKVISLVEKPEAEGGAGLPVVPDMDFAAEGEGLSTYYTFTIHDQVLSRCLRLNHGGKETGQFSREGLNSTRLGSHSVISGPDEEGHKRLVEFLLKVQKEWTDLPEARAAAGGYLRAESATVEVCQNIDRLRLAVGFPPGSRCGGCDPAISLGRDIP